VDKNQQELFKIILEEVLVGISEKEFASLIDTFVELYENKFGTLTMEDTEPEELELMHTKEATEYLKKFQL
jgi:hypothetical protein